MSFIENQVFQFFVRASDCGKPPLYEDVPVEVYIMAKGDNPPLFQRSDQKFFLSEDVAIGNRFKYKKINKMLMFV